MATQWTVEQAKRELDEFEGCVGAVSEAYIEVHHHPFNPDEAILIPEARPKWRRVIAWIELVRLLNSGEELQYHEMGEHVAGHKG